MGSCVGYVPLIMCSFRVCALQLSAAAESALSALLFAAHFLLLVAFVAALSLAVNHSVSIVVP